MTTRSVHLAMCLPLPLLAACIVWRDNAPDHRRPGDRHTRDDTGLVDVDDSGDTGEDSADSGDSDSATDGRDTGADSAGADTGADSGGDDTGTDTGADDSGAPVAWTLSADCDGAPLTFDDARVDVDASAVPAGSRVVLAVSLHNPTTTDDLRYPGVLFASSSGDLTTLGSDWLYGLFAGTSQELVAVYDVAPTAAGGAVELTATTTRLGCDTDGSCPPACTLTFPITVVAP
jgi:hypothetical protein